MILSYNMGYIMIKHTQPLDKTPRRLPIGRIFTVLIIMAISFGGFMYFRSWHNKVRSSTVQASDIQDEVDDPELNLSQSNNAKTDQAVTNQVSKKKLIIPKSDLAPVYYKINTAENVVFLGMDDGLVKNNDAIVYMRDNNIKATLFLNDPTIVSNYDYFNKLIANGSMIENHTVNHPNLTKMTYDQQKKEICAASDRAEKIFGKRPTLFRPPYGAYNDDTRRAVVSCGMNAIIHWHAKADGGKMQYQDGNKLLPGDIVLMHFRPKIMDDLKAFQKARTDAGLEVVLLEDWL